MLENKIKKNRGNKLVFVIAIFIVSISLFSIRPQKTHAITAHDPIDMPFDILNQIQTYLGTAQTYLGTSYEYYQKWWLQNESKLLPYLKRIAIQMVNEMTLSIVSEGNNGKPYIIMDWKGYLYKDTENRAMITTNSLINQALGGRASSSGYNNSEYYTYLKKQSLDYLNPKPLVPNLTTFTPEPTKDVFGSNNMMAFDALLKAENNVFSFVNSSMQTYQKELEKEKEVAIRSQEKGYLPKKDEFGRIMTPATVFEDAYNSASQMGNDMISNATKSDELLGAVVGAVIKTAMNTLKNGLVQVSQMDAVQKVSAGIDYANTGIRGAERPNQSMQSSGNENIQPDP